MICGYGPKTPVVAGKCNKSIQDHKVFQKFYKSVKIKSFLNITKSRSKHPTNPHSAIAEPSYLALKYTNPDYDLFKEKYAAGFDLVGSTNTHIKLSK